MDLKQLTKIKDQGNDLFKNKKLQQAIGKFTQCVSKMQEQQSRDFLSKHTQISKLYVVCLINAALAYINLKKLEKYDDAMKSCDKALSIDTQNIKGLYRRGVARKEKAQILQRTHGIKYDGLLELYNKAKQDFQNLCIIDKTNQLATKTLKQIINDIYRVTVSRGQDVFKPESTKNTSKPQQKIQQQQLENKPKKRGNDMNKIMKQYKVEQVTNLVQQKLRSQYLTTDLPSLRSQLQKAIRLLQKSEDTYIQFVYRLNEEYLTKINPTFDILSELVNILLKKGNGPQSKSVFLAIIKQKGWKLLWKSYSSKQKQILKAKWKQLGLQEENHCS